MDIPDTGRDQPSEPSVPATPTEPVTPVQPVAPPKPRQRGGAALNILLGVAMLVAVGGVAFAVGRMTAPAAAASTPTRTGTFPGGGQGTGAFPGGGQGFQNGAPGAFRGLAGGAITLCGKVTAVTADSITLTTSDGTSITIPTDGSTTYHQQAPGASSDVSVGSEVQVQTALGGAGRFGNGGQGGTGGGAPAPVGSPPPVTAGSTPAPGSSPATGAQGGPTTGGFQLPPAKDVTVLGQ